MQKKKKKSPLFCSRGRAHHSAPAESRPGLPRPSGWREVLSSLSKEMRNSPILDGNRAAGAQASPRWPAAPTPSPCLLLLAALSFGSPARPPASAPPGAGRRGCRGGWRLRGRSPGRAAPSSPSTRPHLPYSSPPNPAAPGSVGEEITTPAVALRKIAAAAAAAAVLVAGDGSEATGGSGEPRKIAEEREARARRGEPVGPRRALVPGSLPSALCALDAPPEPGSEAAG